MLGPELDWTAVEAPLVRELRGRHVTLRPVAADDAEALFAVSQDPQIWTYLPYGPYESVEAMRSRLAQIEGSGDPLFFTVVSDGEPQGIVSYLRIDTENGSIEIGHIWFGTPLQQTTAATEAIYLLGSHAMDELGYRRFEWKCNALNQKSRRAAVRFGFTFEGVFRNHMVVKGRNRDTAWYSITDDEWPAIRDAFQAWLAPDNFDENGVQRRPLLATKGE
ncbi:MAG TPA: GNAT family protein [Thermoleophilaceae bacterium]|nr:GNAT family protein [Thermoleophilaceae bacterium]